MRLIGSNLSCGNSKCSSSIFCLEYSVLILKEEIIFSQILSCGIGNQFISFRIDLNCYSSPTKELVTISALCRLNGNTLIDFQRMFIFTFTCCRIAMEH